MPLVLAWAASCRAVAPSWPPGTVSVAHLGRAAGDRHGLEELRRRFQQRNAGFTLELLELLDVPASPRTRILFVCRGRGWAGVQRRGTRIASELASGDAVFLRPGETLAADPALRAVSFSFASEAPAEIPTFLRPDVDPRIVDAPGGCAPESGAYRRLLLTWLPTNGPYVCHELNAHRVRILDSPTHYHPEVAGFDEFYLVESVEPGAALLHSRAVEAIEAERVERADVGALFESLALEPGDLVYIPRGTLHRGVGGILTQVIAVPGFVPGGEIVVDARLRAINERLGLTGEGALPVHRAPAVAVGPD